MSQADRLLHDAHLRYQRSFEGAKRTFVRVATVDECNAAKQQRDAQSHSTRMGVVKKIAARLNMSQAMIDHLCFDYYKYFCQHDRLLLEKCRKCNRKGLIG